MQIVTVNIPASYIKAFDRLVENHVFPSRSEGMRVAIREFLTRELALTESLLDLDNMETRDGMKVMKPAPPLENKNPAKPTKKIDMRVIRRGW